jgi:hypothetical protein
MWGIYAHTLELYMKTYLLVKKEESVITLKSKKYGHDLEQLRLKCSQSDTRFEEEELKWITHDLRKFTNMNWEFIKYPPKISAKIKRLKSFSNQNLPPIFGKEVMIPPLDLLEEIIKPLVYIAD